MNNKDLPAFPSDYALGTGLTKREYIAAMCLQGLLANPTSVKTNAKEIAHTVLIITDELLKQLDLK